MLRHGCRQHLAVLSFWVAALVELTSDVIVVGATVATKRSIPSLDPVGIFDSCAMLFWRLMCRLSTFGGIQRKVI